MELRMKRLGLGMALMALTTVLTGCYGQFALVHTLYKANGTVENKWARSGLTALMCIIPVYEFAGLGDVIIFNPIEFWSHVNPITNKPSVASSRTQGPGADPSKDPDGWLSRSDKAGSRILLAWHYDAVAKKLSAIRIASEKDGRPSVTLYQSAMPLDGHLGATPRVKAVTFDHGHPVTTMTGGDIFSGPVRL
ncbi:MAG: DUF3332 domain-containing protein [Nitrospirae bacterium]|nr:DUF3332 domain-containing protein [Nitrospirota bacterium]